MVAPLITNYAPSQSAPASFAQVPTADTDFTYESRGIYVGSTGHVAGAILPVAGTQIIAASTTATIADMLVLA